MRLLQRVIGYLDNCEGICTQIYGRCEPWSVMERRTNSKESSRKIRLEVENMQCSESAVRPDIRRFGECINCNASFASDNYSVVGDDIDIELKINIKRLFTHKRRHDILHLSCPS